MQDDINASLREIYPERIYDYYMISARHALPETVEHLASFVHLLPRNKVKQQYIKLTNIQNSALQERLLWKIGLLDPEIKDYAIIKLAHKIKDEELQKRLLKIAGSVSEEKRNEVSKIMSDEDAIFRNR